MKVALALGSGGARGYAHIGAIRELESRGHEVVGVSGASMGAVVGSLLAAGELDRFEEWVRGLAQRDVLRLLDVSFAGGGAIRANKIMGVIGEMLDDVRIEDLAIPYTAVATDLRARREVWFTRGPADIAVRASFAIPSIVTPAIVGGRLMIDGGVTNPVPLEPLASVESDLVLAVSLTGRRAGIRGSTFQESSDPDEPSAVADPKMSKKGGTVTATTARLSGRIRTAAADVRDADLVRLVAARLGQDTSGADAAGPDTAGPDT
ncbi:MAG: patatin-like phospholipase family protein, partial [Dietzia cercidiphylli]